MQNIKKYFMTLALLLTAVTGAWAEEKMVTINSSTMSSGAVTATGFNISDNYLYVTKNTATITTSEGVITKLVIKKYNGSYGDNFTEANVGVTPGTITYGSDEITVTDINAESVTLSRKGGDNWSTSSVDVYYGEPTEWELTSKDGKNWILDKMPASNIELQVEYYAESNLFLGKEALADKANIAVKNGETAVTFDDEGKSTATVTEGNTVTVTYTGSKKVIGVKAAKKAAKPDLLPAVFTVDAGKTVKFSKGNLQATYNGSSWIWGFAEHQWDYIGNAAGNTSINGNGTVSANGTVDLFGWVGASSTWTGAAQYGISNSTATNNVDGYGNVGGEAQKVGWGATVGTGWRTLTKPEWLYLLSTRETGITVNSTNHARYTLAIINTDGTAVKGLIIFPDSYAGGSPAGVTWGTINAKSTFETTCTSAGWTALEAAGCVFLPAAGYREASNVTDAGVGAGYWSSSSSYATSAFALYFESDYMGTQYGGSRKYGFSVRLVRDAN